jgi:hypothetical protein
MAPKAAIALKHGRKGACSLPSKPRCKRSRPHGGGRRRGPRSSVCCEAEPALCWPRHSYPPFVSVFATAHPEPRRTSLSFVALNDALFASPGAGRSKCRGFSATGTASAFAGVPVPLPTTLSAGLWLQKNRKGRARRGFPQL